MVCRDTKPGLERERRLTQILSELDQLGVARTCGPGRFLALAPAAVTAGPERAVVR
jgi:hypothetical protein